MSLPNSINYSDIPAALKPDVVSTTIILNPVNSKSSYGPGDIFYFDFTTSGRGFIDPKSIYISYKAIATCGTTVANIIGVPVYTPFYKLDTIINSQTIETISQYNQICQIYVNCNMSVADKAGVQSQYGYYSLVDGDITQFDYRRLTVSTANSYFVSAPLICNILTGCEKMIPAFLMPQIRIQFTIDTLSNIVDNSGGTYCTDFQIYNPQITYQLIDFGSDVQNSIISLGKFLIKSNGYSNSAVALPVGINGNQSIIFNQRYASIKSAFIVASGGTNCVNKTFDFIDITNGGTIQLLCGGIAFPQLALNAGINRSAIIQELRKSQGQLYDMKNSMSINSVEFAYSDSSLITNPNTTTSVIQPGKFIVGIDLTKIGCGSSKNLLNGTSSQNSPITVLLNIASATISARNLNLILNYDALLEIDPSTSMVSARV